MKCPVDGAQLVMTERSGVEIDYCPQCRGVWLDRGELDKIVDRATPAVTLQEPAREAPRREEPRRDDFREPRRDDHREPRREEYRGDDGYRQDGHYRKKKRGGFLEDLFDF